LVRQNCSRRTAQGRLAAGRSSNPGCNIDNYRFRSAGHFRAASISTEQGRADQYTNSSASDIGHCGKGQSGLGLRRISGELQEIVTAWMKANRLDASRIEWQGDPRPSELAAGNARRLSGYLVIFNTPDRAGAKTRSVLIRDGVVVNNSGF